MKLKRLSKVLTRLNGSTDSTATVQETTLVAMIAKVMVTTLTKLATETDHTQAITHGLVSTVNGHTVDTTVGMQDIGTTLLTHGPRTTIVNSDGLVTEVNINHLRKTKRVMLLKEQRRREMPPKLQQLKLKEMLLLRKEMPRKVKRKKETRLAPFKKNLIDSIINSQEVILATDGAMETPMATRDGDARNQRTWNGGHTLKRTMEEKEWFLQTPTHLTGSLSNTNMLLTFTATSGRFHPGTSTNKNS